MLNSSFPKMEVRDLSKSFVAQSAAQSKDLLVLDKIDLKLYPREFVCLVGTSGCGKSTLLNIAAGLVTPPPHRGDVEPVSEQARRELAQRLGQCPGKPLSEIIIEERGPM